MSSFLLHQQLIVYNQKNLLSLTLGGCTPLEFPGSWTSFLGKDLLFASPSPVAVGTPCLQLCLHLHLLFSCVCLPNKPLSLDLRPVWKGHYGNSFKIPNIIFHKKSLFQKKIIFAGFRSWNMCISHMGFTRNSKAKFWTQCLWFKVTFMKSGVSNEMSNF